MWFPQRLCTQGYNPLPTTAGSRRRAHIHTGGEVEQPSQSWRMLQTQDRSRTGPRAGGALLGRQEVVTLGETLKHLQQSCFTADSPDSGGGPSPPPATPPTQKNKLFPDLYSSL